MTGSYLSWAKGQYQLMSYAPSLENTPELQSKKALDMEFQNLTYTDLRTVFLEKGAKTWRELPEDKMLPLSRNLAKTIPGGGLPLLQIKYNMPTTSKWGEFLPEFKPSELMPGRYMRYRGPDEPAWCRTYLELFERVWDGDTQRINSMTLRWWGPAEVRPPLIIAVSDSFLRISLVGLALYRKEFMLARRLLEIARIQYEAGKVKVKYGNDSESQSTSETGNDPEAKVAEKLRDPLDSVDAKSIARYASITISPLEILRTPGNFIYFLDKATRESIQAKLPEVNEALDRPTFTSATLALAQDDFDSFWRILQIADELKKGSAIVISH
jgi:hypothetical protein